MTEPADSFSRRTLGWIVGLCIGSFLLAFLLAAYGSDLGEPRTAAANTFSHSALGHRALVELLEQHGLEVRIRRALRAREFGPAAPLLALEPLSGLELDGNVLLQLHDAAWDENAALVLVLPKWLGRPDRRARWVDAVDLRALASLETALGDFLHELGLDPLDLRRLGTDPDLECEDAAGQRYAMELEVPQLIEPAPDWEPLVRCSELVLVSRWTPTVEDWGEGPALYLVSDPDLLNNHGLADGRHAELVLHSIIDRLDAQRLVIDETAHGFVRNEGLVAELLRFPLVVPVVHVLLVVGLVVWSGTGRFGRPRPAAPRFVGGKQVLIDNAAQLMNLGGHSRESLESYFDQTLRAVGAHYFFPPDTPVDELRDKLQTISNGRGLTMDLAALQRRMRRAGTERAVRVASNLHRWRLEMTDGTRTHP